MKIRLFAILLVMALFGSCVDDYTDYNPTGRVDAPWLRINSASNNQVLVVTPADRFTNELDSYALFGETIEYTVSVVDAPGKFSGVTVTPSIPEFGTATIDEASVAALVGKESGDFKFSFKSNPALVGEIDRSFELIVDVSDSQLDDKGQLSPKVTRITLPVVIQSCIASGIAGRYRVTAASGTTDGNEAYTLADLKGEAGGDVFVTITEDKPGRFSVNELTGGAYLYFYGLRARLKANFCGTAIKNYVGASTLPESDDYPATTFTVTGTLNANGTIDMAWSYAWDDGETPEDPGHGTYTLTPVE